MSEISIQENFDAALQLQRAGRFAEAETIYLRIIQNDPRHADANHMLGVIAYLTNRGDQAISRISQAIAINPAITDYHYNLGKILASQNRLEEALAAYYQAAKLTPEDAQTHHAIAIVLHSQKNWPEAVAAYQRAIELRPDLADALNNLANLWLESGNFTAAIETYRRVIALQPKWSLAFYNLGSALSAKGDIDGAIDAFEQALILEPSLILAHNNLANALKEKGRFDLAIEQFEKLLAIEPNNAMALTNLAGVLFENGQIESAIACYDRALAAEPQRVSTHHNRLFTLHYHPQYDVRALTTEYQKWNQKLARPLAASILPHTNDPDPGRKLKIGYVSADFRAHPVGHFLISPFENHDRTHFEIVGWSDVPWQDEITQRLRKCCDAWHNICGWTDEQLANTIRESQIDILVDLSLHSAGSHLLAFARRPAPIQISWLGYPGSGGLETINYRLTDQFLEPSENEYPLPEKPLFLPDCFWCYNPMGTEPSVNALPAISNGFITFGCLNNFNKVSDATLDLWARVMTAIENSRLLLLAPQGSARARVLERLNRGGIEENRIDFVPRQPRPIYLRSFHNIDICLDTLPYNGHTTSLDSLWMGVPVVTRIGNTPPGRGTYSQLSNLGLGELAGRNDEEFVNIATLLANDLPRLERLRRTLRDRMERSPLMDGKRFAKNLEAIYRQVWRKWCQTKSRR
jgi:protein O-GlcNAc transferase